MNNQNIPGGNNQINNNIYMGPEKSEQAESTTLGKYMCTTSLSAEGGKHALLVEFGGQRGQTEGFYGEIHFVTPYEKREAWIGAPLRTDKQGGLLVQTSVTTRENPDRTAYGESFMSPAITRTGFTIFTLKLINPSS